VGKGGEGVSLKEEKRIGEEEDYRLYKYGFYDTNEYVRDIKFNIVGFLRKLIGLPIEK
jgi:hypothetical protein